MCIRDSWVTDVAGSEYNERFQVYQDILFKKVDGGERDWRLVTPEGLINKIVWDCHIRYGYFGARK